MAYEEHRAILSQGVETWNRWRRENRDVVPDLTDAVIDRKVELKEINFRRARLDGATLNGVYLGGSYLQQASLRDVKMSNAQLFGANMWDADLSDAELDGTSFQAAGAWYSHFDGAKLRGADLRSALLADAYLTHADLTGANLSGAQLVRTTVEGTNFKNCMIYGISAWDLIGKPKDVSNLIINRDEQEIIVDDLEVAQFVNLLLRNEKIRNVIDTVGKKGVLLLGRFTDGRLAILERLQEELRGRDFLPMVFNFDKPKVKDFTETVRLLAGLSCFVIADITNPRSAPLELQATVPECMIPFVPILEKGEKPFAMFRDLWLKHRDWVFEPIAYPSLDVLVQRLDIAIVRPALERSAELLARKAEKVRVRNIEDITGGTASSPS